MDHSEWWQKIGSSLRPLANEDAEEHAKRVSLVAWDARGLEIPEGLAMVMVKNGRIVEYQMLDSAPCLIHAAPEILEALELMLKQFTKTPSTLKDSEVRVKAHSAIAKATGGEQ